MPLIRAGKEEKGVREGEGDQHSSQAPPPLHPLVYNKAACTTPVIKLLPPKKKKKEKEKKHQGSATSYRPRSDWSRRRTRRGVPEPRSIIDVCAQLQASRHQQSVAQARLKDS